MGRGGLSLAEKFALEDRVVGFQPKFSSNMDN